MINQFTGIEIPRMLTVNECSKLAGLAKYHIRRLVQESKIKFIRSGTKYLINILIVCFVI